MNSGTNQWYFAFTISGGSETPSLVELYNLADQQWEPMTNEVCLFNWFILFFFLLFLFLIFMFFF
jgi:hypothetical protein